MSVWTARGGALTAVGLLACAGAPALELSVSPELNLGSRATDNVLFSPNDLQEALGFDTGGRLNLLAESPTLRVNLTPDFNFRRSAAGGVQDADEYGLRSQHQWKATERLTAALQADYYQDSTLSTELTDVGRQNNISDRATVSLQPSLVLALDALTQLNASYAYTDITTDATANAGLVDYSYQMASLGANRILSSSWQVFVTGFISWFDVPSQNSFTATYGVQTGATWTIDEATRVNAAIGYLTSNIDFVDLVPVLVFDPAPRIVLLTFDRQASTAGPIASVGIEREFERLRVSGNYVRQVSPTLRGAQSLEDNMAVRLNYDWSSVLALFADGQYIMRSAQADVNQAASDDLNRNQLSVSGGVSWRATQLATVRAEYRYATSESNLLQSVANEHSLFVSLKNRFDPFFIGLW
jgi:hypothetical protein